MKCSWSKRLKNRMRRNTKDKLWRTLLKWQKKHKNLWKKKNRLQNVSIYSLLPFLKLPLVEYNNCVKFQQITINIIYNLNYNKWGKVCQIYEFIMFHLSFKFPTDHLNACYTNFRIFNLVNHSKVCIFHPLSLASDVSVKRLIVSFQ